MRWAGHVAHTGEIRQTCEPVVAVGAAAGTDGKGGLFGSSVNTPRATPCGLPHNFNMSFAMAATDTLETVK
jgi:hypothetical protein